MISPVSTGVFSDAISSLVFKVDSSMLAVFLIAVCTKLLTASLWSTVISFVLGIVSFFVLL